MQSKLEMKKMWRTYKELMLFKDLHNINTITPLNAKDLMRLPMTPLGKCFMAWSCIMKPWVKRYFEAKGLSDSIVYVISHSHETYFSRKANSTYPQNMTLDNILDLTFDVYPYSCLSSTSPYFLSAWFIWGSTPEGSDFWDQEYLEMKTAYAELAKNGVIKILVYILNSP